MPNIQVFYTKKSTKMQGRDKPSSHDFIRISTHVTFGVQKYRIQGSRVIHTSANYSTYEMIIYMCQKN